MRWQLEELLAQGQLKQVTYGKFRLNLRQSYVTVTLTGRR